MITLRNVLVIFAVLVVGTLTIIINNVQFAIVGCFVWLNSSVLFFFFSGWGGFPPPYYMQDSTRFYPIISLTIAKNLYHSLLLQQTRYIVPP